MAVEREDKLIPLKARLEKQISTLSKQTSASKRTILNLITWVSRSFYFIQLIAMLAFKNINWFLMWSLVLK